MAEHVDRLDIAIIAAHLAANPHLMHRLEDLERRWNMLGDQQPHNPILEENQEARENNDPRPVQELRLEDGAAIMEEFFRVQEEIIAWEEQQRAEANNNLPEDD
ncbi:hypothetical protein B9Z55_023265 [Caenorhabditis nigoni]|uniref:Uncharacterized protein n=1 Tax=Caenorhabditis nigoni TaxID=1611254 RepID=A0A2G5SPD8_9PELO|nr:hypothetical protein B9Z55_023265 [Caenorhabditis nigoni]